MNKTTERTRWFNAYTHKPPKTGRWECKCIFNREAGVHFRRYRVGHGWAWMSNNDPADFGGYCDRWRGLAEEPK